MDRLDILLDTRIISLLLGFLLPLFFYWYTTRNFDYWKKKGIPFAKPYPLVGSLADYFIKSFEDVETERYNKFGRIYGSFEGSKPSIVVGEPELAKCIFVKDFQYFSFRRLLDTGDPMYDNVMPVSRGEAWKRMRTIISPTFTTGKLKRLMNIFNDCSASVVENYTSKQFETIDVLKVYGAFSVDVIASSAFSTKVDSHKNPENKFVKYADGIFGFRAGLAILTYVFMPWIVKLFKIKMFDPKHTEFFSSVIFQVIQERKRTGEKRNDFLQLVMDATSELSNDEKGEDNSEDIVDNYGDDSKNHEVFKTKVNKHLTLDEMVANGITFFVAGYSTAATTLGLATYFLALNPDIQDKLFNEIKDALETTDGELTYEVTQKMKYLDNVISETLRIHPPLCRTDRTSEIDYKLGDTGFIIPKGMVVTIPILAMHRDPIFFPDPLKFNPDRFRLEEREKQIPYSYMPFGAGPRNCLGMRFALIEMKVCVVHVFSHFYVKPCPETKELKFHNGGGILKPVSIKLKLESRDDCPLKLKKTS